MRLVEDLQQRVFGSKFAALATEPNSRHPVLRNRQGTGANYRINGRVIRALYHQL